MESAGRDVHGTHLVCPMLRASRKSHVETDRFQHTRFACAQSAAEKFGRIHPSIVSGLSNHPTRRVAYLESVRGPSGFRAPAGVSFAKCVVTALPYCFVPPLRQCELDFGYMVDGVVTYFPATQAKGKHEVVQYSLPL